MYEKVSQVLEIRTSVACSCTTQESLQCAILGCFGYKYKGTVHQKQWLAYHDNLKLLDLQTAEVSSRGLSYP